MLGKIDYFNEPPNKDWHLFGFTKERNNPAISEDLEKFQSSLTIKVDDDSHIIYIRGFKYAPRNNMKGFLQVGSSSDLEHSDKDYLSKLVNRFRMIQSFDPSRKNKSIDPIEIKTTIEPRYLPSNDVGGDFVVEGTEVVYWMR